MTIKKIEKALFRITILINLLIWINAFINFDIANRLNRLEEKIERTEYIGK